MLKIIYHNDEDGRCAGAIAYNYFKEEHTAAIELIEMDYTKPFPFNTITEKDTIYMLDFCLQPFSDMIKLINLCPDFVHIDHHISAIKNFELHPEIVLSGIRSTKNAACMLTWKFFYADKEPYPVIKYIEDMDIWKWEFGDDTRNLCSGLELYDYRPDAKIWGKLFNYGDAYGNMVEILKREGEIVEKYKKENWGEILFDFGFEVTVRGYKCYACNQGRSGSSLFNSLSESYDIVIPFVYDGKNKLWRVSLYSKTVDVEQLAVYFGALYGKSGGGHKYAAGFESPIFPTFLLPS